MLLLCSSSSKCAVGLTFLLLAVGTHSQRSCGQRMMSKDRSGTTPWPWMVAITRKVDEDYFPHCSGFMIDHIHVITGASCFAIWKNITGYQARIGSVDQTRGTVYQIVSMVGHESFEVHKPKDDIAILKLDRPVTEPGFNPVCLPNQEVRRLNLDKERTTYAGWGQRESDLYGPLENYGTILQQMRGIPVVPNRECECIYRQHFGENFVKVFPTGIECRCASMMCAGFPESTKAICQGAVGGPLMINWKESWYVVGILSFETCGHKAIPNVFTRVSEYLEWIGENIWS